MNFIIFDQGSRAINLKQVEHIEFLSTTVKFLFVSGKDESYSGADVQKIASHFK